MRARPQQLLPWLGAALALFSAACAPSGVSLTVRVQSGLRAGHEVRFVEVSLYAGAADCSGAGAPVRSWSRSLGARDQASLGDGTLTVAEHDGLAPGVYTLHVEARRPGEGSAPDSGPVLLERCVLTSVTNARVVRIPLTSDCINVTCPAPGGSAAFDQCINGRCVDPRCDPDDPASAEFCCDSAALGDACETAPTICRSADDCPPRTGCLGAPSCDRGVCVEPVEDGCGEGLYCDAVEARCLAEPAAEPIDAGVADAPRPDGSSPGVGEDCTTVGDEDGDATADCLDVECQVLAICMMAGCAPVAPGPPPSEAIPTPAHWYRGDASILVNDRGAFCAVRDLVGHANVNLVVSSGLSTGTVGGQPSIAMAGGASLGASAWEPFVDPAGDYSVLVVSQALGAGPLATVLSARPPAPATGSTFDLTQRMGMHLVQLEGSVFELGAATMDAVVLESLSVASLTRGAAFLDALEYRRNGATIAPILRSGTGLADPPDPPRGLASSTLLSVNSAGGSLQLAEVLLYDRRLSATERDSVEAYLAARYGITID